MYRILTIMVCLLSLSTVQPVFSQTAVDAKNMQDDCDECDLPNNTIYVVNRENKTLSFSVKPRGGHRWSRFSLKSTKSMEIACSGCSFSMDRYYFQMMTVSEK